MLKSVEGIFRNGKVELLESPPTQDEARVVVTFLPAREPVQLRERGMDEAQAADLRARLQAFREGWDRPEMGVYDWLYAAGARGASGCRAASADSGAGSSVS